MTEIRTRPGFSVMETLVAVALLAIAILPLYAFQQTLADTAARLQTASALLDAQESALAVLQTIDPIAEPQGEMDLGEWRLSWESRELVEQMEQSVGKDLQYIRINGTLVGGLVGLLLHALTQLAAG